MLQIFRELYDRQHGRHRSNRLIGAGLALLAEAILVLLVLSMALVEQKPPKRAVSLVSVNITQPESKRPESKQPEADKPRPARISPTPAPDRPYHRRACPPDAKPGDHTAIQKCDSHPAVAALTHPAASRAFARQGDDGAAR